MNLTHENKRRVTTAVLLAAGTGSRLYPLTKKEPKCLTMVNGRPILERLISNLNAHGFKRLIVVTGHLENCIRNFLGNQSAGIKIEYVFSPKYKTTNNIYSLWMARKKIKESFLLIESDLVFDNTLLSDMLYPDRIAAALLQPWMNGTCVTVNKKNMVNAFLSDTTELLGVNKYKTVNIYTLSLKSWVKILKILNKYISAGKVNDYYEKVFADMVIDGNLDFEKVSFDHKPWYEIDNQKDLAQAEKLFPHKSHALSGIINTHEPKKNPIGVLIPPVISHDTGGVLNVAK
ncbi:MAG: phosphocholine cytidylyltransferase family protein [Spirochaetales bacterium]|nr:phosphocholine cytidylyltransferase family protein [Spirochaetales bacterium]